jgi:hypothetical protein
MVKRRRVPVRGRIVLMVEQDIPIAVGLPLEEVIVVNGNGDPP